MRKTSPREVIKHRGDRSSRLVPSKPSVDIEVPMSSAFVASEPEAFRDVEPPSSGWDMRDPLEVSLAHPYPNMVCNRWMFREVVVWWRHIADGISNRRRLPIGDKAREVERLGEFGVPCNNNGPAASLRHTDCRYVDDCRTNLIAARQGHLSYRFHLVSSPGAQDAGYVFHHDYLGLE